MQLRRRIRPRDEEGTTLVELLVGLGMGMVVLAGLSMVLIVTLHGNARVDARVEATDNARVAMSRLLQELHSACVTPTMAPVQSGSKPTTLIFDHGSYGAVTTPTASEPSVTTEITYQGDTLTETTSSVSRTLLSNVGPISATEPIFSYWKYENGSLVPVTPPSSGLEAKQADEIVLVKIAFEASPKSEPIRDAGAATEIRNSATFVLTPPAYNATTALPCR